MTTVAGAAFARYAREAIDYTTGRRLIEETVSAPAGR